MSQLESIVASRSVLICTGSGGVGKTTTAAAIALGAAIRGRRVCVVTIDPARRLADALGVGALTNVAQRVEGPWRGELSAVMLDAKSTFDDLIARYAHDEAQVARILSNRLYRNLVSALSGTQEYMATEKLYDLHSSGQFDLVVVDTPPTRNTLDFLDAPRRLASFLDNRIFRLLLMPGRAYFKAMSVASQLLLRTIAKIAGSEIVDDTMAFFQAFEGMEAGFRDRAAHVEQLLSSDTTAFVIVAAPRHASIVEAMAFATHLVARDQQPDALIVNRMHPDFGEPLEDEANSDGVGSAWRSLTDNLAELAKVAQREEILLGELIEKVAPSPVIRVPFLNVDVHDLSGLGTVVRYLFDGEVPLVRGEDPDRR